MIYEEYVSEKKIKDVNEEEEKKRNNCKYNKN